MLLPCKRAILTQIKTSFVSIRLHGKYNSVEIRKLVPNPLVRGRIRELWLHDVRVDFYCTIVFLRAIFGFRRTFRVCVKKSEKNQNLHLENIIDCTQAE